jgi:purine-binding chemotaxis protein CheW
MSNNTSANVPTVATVAELRREFDAAFAVAPQVETARRESLLAVRIAGDGFAMRVSQIAGLFADKAVTPLTSPLAELKGLAGFRGRAAPVYDLGALLGYGSSGATRWLVLARTPEPLALAFDAFESHFSVATAAAAGEIVRAPGSTLKVGMALRQQVFDAVRYRAPDRNAGQSTMRPLIDLDAIVDSIRRRCLAPAQPGSTST